VARLLVPTLILLYFTFCGFFERTVWGRWHGFPLDHFWIIFGAWAVLTAIVAGRFHTRRWLWFLPVVFLVIAAGSWVYERRAYAALHKARTRLQENRIQLFWGFVFYSRSFDLCVQTFIDGDKEVPDEQVESVIADAFREDGFRLKDIYLTKTQR
jgi:hypothetical protein